MPDKNAKQKKKKRAARLRRLLVALLIMLFLLAIYCAMKDIDPVEALHNAILPLPTPMPQGYTHLAPPDDEKALNVYVIDVGQGDCMLLISPNGRTMLIDAGESTALYPIRSFLKGMRISRLDAVIATHPHSDHIGGMAGILRSFDVGEFFLPNVTGECAAYKDMKTALSQSVVKVSRLSADGSSSIDWDSEVTIDVLSPYSDVSYSSLNDYSIVLRISYGSTSMLFTGDAEGCSEYSAEYTALARSMADKFKCTVLKVGHHGSASSTSDAFLAAADPDYAIISVGHGNDFGHPHQSTLDKLKNAHVKVFRTDESGTLHVTMDGATTVISSVQPFTLRDRLSGWWKSLRNK